MVETLEAERKSAVRSRDPTADVVEPGSVNASIHKIDEHVRVADVADLCRMYERTLELLLLRPPEA
jgi:acetylornithine deacetylase/succinyl-diaminopimelate desuccinylase-like protein